MAPTNLEECIAELEKMYNQEVPQGAVSIKKMEEGDFLATSHHSLGRYLRNEWGLWKKGTALVVYFKKLGLWHPDDMSGLILCSFHRHLRGKPLEVEAQVAYYKAHWEKMGCKPED